MAEINKNSTYYLEFLVINRAGDPVTGLTVPYRIERSSDDALIASGNLVEVGNGVYKSSYLFSNLGQYRVLYMPPAPYTNDIEGILVTDQGAVSISAKLDRILGLCQENYRVVNPTYNKNGDLVDGIIKIYETASDLENDVNPIAVYEVNTSYGAGSKYNRHVMEYTVKRIS